MKQQPDEIIARCKCGSYLFFYDRTEPEQHISCAECFSVWGLDDEGYLIPSFAPSPYDDTIKCMMRDTYPKITLRARQKTSIIDMMFE